MWFPIPNEKNNMVSAGCLIQALVSYILRFIGSPLNHHEHIVFALKTQLQYKS